jgi:prephenate dehydrogenase
VQPGAGPQRPPVFDKIGIVGLGLIGGSIALAARQLWPTGLVVAVDVKGTLEKAMVLHAIDVAADDPVVLADVDLVILAAPVHQNLDVLASLPEHLSRSVVITDTGSTKREIVEAARRLPPNLTFVGGHPLGGAARSGIEHARPDLFRGRPWLFTPATDTAGAAVAKLCEFATALGARPCLLSATEHDHLLAYISHLPQLVSTALMHLVGDTVGREGLALTGRGLQDVTRLASSPAGIWKDVCASNADELGPALDALIKVLSELRADLSVSATIEAIFQSANYWRDQLQER